MQMAGSVEEVLINDNEHGKTYFTFAGTEAYWWPMMWGKAVSGQLRWWITGITAGMQIVSHSGSYKLGPNGEKNFGKVGKGTRNNILASQGRTQWQQGVDEINTAILERQRDGFFAVDEFGRRLRFVTKMDRFDVTFKHPGFMLANDYEADNTFLSGWWLASEKLDGERGMAMVYQGGIVLFSRGNRMFAYMDHITAVLGPWFERLPPGTIIDGELYRDSKTFNYIAGVVNRTVERHPETNLMEYHIFDIFTPDLPEPYYQRYMRLAAVAHEAGMNCQNTFYEGRIVHSTGGGKAGYPLRLVGYRTVFNADEVADYHDEAVARGVEGLMLRNADALYQEKRADSLLKVKKFFDEEVTIVNVIQGNGNEAGYALLIVLDKMGKQYTVRPRGDFETRRRWLQNSGALIGRNDYTVIHFGRSKEHGGMRFPRGKGFRNYIAV